MTVLYYSFWTSAAFLCTWSLILLAVLGGFSVDGLKLQMVCTFGKAKVFLSIYFFLLIHYIYSYIWDASSSLGKLSSHIVNIPKDFYRYIRHNCLKAATNINSETACWNQEFRKFKESKQRSWNKKFNDENLNSYNNCVVFVFIWSMYQTCTPWYWKERRPYVVFLFRGCIGFTLISCFADRLLWQRIPANT